MKKIITLCLAIVALANLQAQIVNFKITPDTFVVNGTAMDIGLKVDFEVSNKAPIMRTIIWERITVTISPDWETQVCDPIACWAPGKSDGEFTIKGFQDSIMILDAFPNGKEGGAYVKMKIYEKGKPNAFSYGRYRFNALPVSTADEVEATKLRLFPNPTADYFVLEGNAPLTEVQVLSLEGRVLKTFPYIENEIYEIQDLVAGAYLLSLNGENGKRLATKRLMKL